MRVCVIPARGGSKRIPLKNTRSFCGRPIVVWSIDAALTSGLFDHVVVSTDSHEVADVALAAGAEVPFERPADLADDHTPTNPVVAHAVAELGNPAVDRVCCLYATAPFVRPEDLARGLDLLDATGADFSFAATTFAFPVQRALLLDESGFVRPMFPDSIGLRSQDLPHAVHDAGQFYWGSPEAFASYDIVFNATAAAVLLPRLRVQDIDTEEDWNLAEALFRRGEAG